jgi:hypothetical protein
MTHFKKHLSLSRTYFVIIGILIIIGIGAMVAPFNRYSEGMDEPSQDEKEAEKEEYKEGMLGGPPKSWSTGEWVLFIFIIILIGLGMTGLGGSSF